jgi:hypothetical protein
VWRVEASAGRSASPGVFDLSTTAASAGSLPSWHLVRVAD